MATPSSEEGDKIDAGRDETWTAAEIDELQAAICGTKGDDLFTREFYVYALRVPLSHCHPIRAALRRSLLSGRSIPTVRKHVSPTAHSASILLRFGAPHPPLHSRGSIATDSHVNIRKTILLPSAFGNMISFAEHSMSPEQVASSVLEELPEELRTTVLRQHQNCETESELVDVESFTVGLATWRVEEVLAAVLPRGVQAPVAFERVGHLAHINLRFCHEHFKHLIGATLLKKLNADCGGRRPPAEQEPRRKISRTSGGSGDAGGAWRGRENDLSVRTVVNKKGITGGAFRTFEMDVIAGDPDFECCVTQQGIRFELDFSRVYWNSRLENEHARVVQIVVGSSVRPTLLDPFAGVGPFALPTARFMRLKERAILRAQRRSDHREDTDGAAGGNTPSRRGGDIGSEKVCRVFAGDLNPVSVEYLKRNAEQNGLEQDVEIHCECARESLRRVLRERFSLHRSLVQRRCKVRPKDPVHGDAVHVTHIVMNFPSGAPEFLDELRGVLPTDCLKYEGGEVVQWGKMMPTVMCYCFARDEEGGPKQALARVARALYCIPPNGAYSNPQNACSNGDDIDCGNFAIVPEAERGRVDDAKVLEETKFVERARAKVHAVRNVAPGKAHVCIQFELPIELAQPSSNPEPPGTND